MNTASLPASLLRCVLLGMLLRHVARALAPTSTRLRRSFLPSVASFRTKAHIVLKDTTVDDQGRRIRGGATDSSEGGVWGNSDDAEDSWYESSPSSGARGGNSYNNGPARRESRDRRGDRDSSRGSRSPGGGRPRFSRRPDSDAEQQRKINMNALDEAGFVHLYGLAPVLNALQVNRRDFTRPEDFIDLKSLDAESYAHELRQRERKPEAQFSPWLFVQEQRGQRSRSSDKSSQEQEILRLAQERNIPVATVDKGVLNTLSGNRPHQGVCLRCGRLDFTPLTRIPYKDDNVVSPSLWLVLDEVVDPQNLGALLRSSYFLGGGHRVQVLVCAKNSAPPSPTVSAASAGALELLNVYSTSNLPRTLATAEQDGFAVIGASSSVTELDIPVYDLDQLEVSSEQPTILVLGSEGSGLRHLVAKSCTAFVRIPAGTNEESTLGVDSLNVSVTGGILLWRLLNQLAP